LTATPSYLPSCQTDGASNGHAAEFKEESGAKESYCGVMFTHRTLDYKRNLRVGFGDYLQAWTPNHKTNSMHWSINGCIALMPTGNVQRTVRCFQLNNGAIVNRDNFTILPVPDHVIAHLNDLAARDKRPIHPEAAIALGNLETKWLTTTFDHVRTPTFIRPSMSHVRAQQLCYS